MGPGMMMPPEMMQAMQDNPQLMAGFLPQTQPQSQSQIGNPPSQSGQTQSSNGQANQQGQVHPMMAGMMGTPGMMGIPGMGTIPGMSGMPGMVLPDSMTPQQKQQLMMAMTMQPKGPSPNLPFPKKDEDKK